MVNKMLNWLKEMEEHYTSDWNDYHLEDDYGAMLAYRSAIEKLQELSKNSESDLERLINDFCVPLESEKICEDLTVWSIDGGNSTWCEMNCGRTTGGDCPGASCYKEWLKMKRCEAASESKT